jgi:hypothetical protein
MKFRALILPCLLCCLTKSIAQQPDNTFPLAVTIKVDKESTVKIPKQYLPFSDQQVGLHLTTDSVSQKQYDIEISIKNKDTVPIFIWLMTCSWMENFEINNSYIFWGMWSCLKNFPELVKITPNENRTYKTTLVKSIGFEHPEAGLNFGQQVETTRLGLILIDDVYKPKLKPFDGFTQFDGYDLAMQDKSCWKIVWSNPLYLLTKIEAGFK